MKTLLAADLFCGAGGASLGFHRAAKALNIRTNLLAVNHWPMAIETHKLNFPEGPECRHLHGRTPHPERRRLRRPDDTTAVVHHGEAG